MNAQRAAEVQAVLEGISLPATRSELIAYAREQDPSLVHDLEALPDEQFRSIDDVGRLLTPVPAAPIPDPDPPRPESGAPPGGRDYVIAHPGDTGTVRYDAPPDNPPQKAIEHASQLQKQQEAERGG